MDILIIRHAQTPLNAARDTIGGRAINLPLNAEGERQALACGQALALEHSQKGLAVDAIYCSPAVRTRRTLELILEGAPYLKETPIHYDERLLELGRGEWEGQPAAQIITPQMKERMRANSWHFKAPGGESQWDVEQRMLGAVADILKAHPSGRVLVISHGNAIRCLLRGITGLDPKYTHDIYVENAHTFKIRHTDTGWKLLSVNYPPSMINASEQETSYLKGPLTLNATADLHGHLPALAPADLVCICGDITPDSCRRDASAQARWFYDHFIPWVESLPCKKVVLVAGNHDYCFEELITTSPIEKLVYLHNQSVCLYGYLFYETPNVLKPNKNLAFYQEPDRLRETFRAIPSKLDFLLCHAAPYGVNDCGLYANTNQDIGSPELTEAIQDKEIGWVLCGHIHSGNHTSGIWRGKHVANVGYCDDNKMPAHPVLRIECP